MQPIQKKLKKAKSLFDTGKLQRAYELYAEAAKAAPQSAEANYYMGVLLKDSQHKELALQHLQFSAQDAQFKARSYNAIGNMYKDLGNSQHYTQFAIRAFLAEPDNADYSYDAMTALFQIKFTGPNADVLTVIDQLLALPHIDHDRLFTAWFSLYQFTDSYARLKKLSKQTTATAAQINAATDDAAIILPLCQMLVQDEEYETILTTIRRQILQVEDHDSLSLGFLVALAIQGFNNEYIWDVREDEQKIIDALMAKPAKTTTLAELLLIAAYQPLHTLNNIDEYAAIAQSDASGLAMNVWQQQVTEPQREAEIKPTIPAVTEVTDAMSQQVQAQYEQNPYPRWNVFGVAAPRPFKEYLRRVFHFWPASVVDALPHTQKVLVAGCGTGRQALELAANFTDNRITAIDITLSSLAYAMRKHEELGTKHITFGQADILKLKDAMQPESYDVIHCTGVLHHMEDPFLGWQEITSLLKPKGLMSIGLYSSIARRPVTEARTLIAKQKLSSSLHDIRKMRRYLRDNASDAVSWIFKSKDFYTASDCRDLLFHVNEHQYTLPQIADMLDTLGLEFMGFHGNIPFLVKTFEEMFPNESMPGSLKSWNTLEEAHPDSFKGMYQFWVRKKN